MWIFNNFIEMKLHCFLKSFYTNTKNQLNSLKNILRIFVENPKNIISINLNIWHYKR